MTIPDYMRDAEIIAFSTPFKVACVLLVILDILIYRKYHIGDKITEDFPSYRFSWLSLGMVIFAVFLVCGYQTDAFYATIFVVIGAGVGLSYLFGQYAESRYRNSLKEWLSVLFLAVIDILLCICLPSTAALIIILIQAAFTMQLESRCHVSSS